MKLAKYLANLGYGNRREAQRMLISGRVTRRDGMRLEEGDSVDPDDIMVDGEPLDPAPGVVIMLHKPVGYVCSTTDSSNPVVYELLSSRLLLRSPVVATVGRLDLDTSGLLLLTDDGKLNHRLTSPKHHIPRVYEAQLHSPLRGDEAELFASGTLLLKGDDAALAPAQLEVIDATHAWVTVTEGRYHQVRRMFGAVGNHVDALHRIAVGQLTLGDLPSGQWRVLDDRDRELLK